jgi:hypothetical protein
LAGDRLSRREKRALLFWVVAGLAGAIFAYKNYFQAFPEASVNFKITRQQAVERAESFLGELGESTSGYRSAVAFDVDNIAKTYLERKLGLKEANRLMSGTLDIWYWDVRFFQPLKEEEFHVRLNPAGQVIGFDHHVPEAQPGGRLDRDAAEQKAQAFFVTRLGDDPSAWQLLPEEANSTRRSERTDLSFTWEKRGFRAKDAPYRLAIRLQGDRIGSASRYLLVPENWRRSFARLRSGNDTLALVFTVPYVILLAVAVWLGIRLSRTGQTSWRTPILLGFSVAGILFLQGLNSWPLWGTIYDTNTSYSSFLALRIAQALGFGLLSAITITVVLPGGEPLYRKSQPERLQLYKAFTLRGLRSKEFFSAATVGLSLAAVHIGYVVAFYIIASWLGAWAPQDLNYEESVNTLFPWITGAAIGLLAATNEEFTFRLFAIPFFQRVTGSRFTAVVLPAFLWSFLHSNYPQEPAYTRGIEIGIFGVLAGLVMLRWGILATLIWHYTVDAGLVGLFLVRSHNLYFKVSGAVVALAALAPLLFATFSYLTRGGFEKDEDLRNAAAPTPDITFSSVAESAPAGVAARHYTGLRPVLLGLLALCMAIGGAVLWKVRPPAIGDYLRLTVNARSAAAKADEALKSRGGDPNAYRKAVIFHDVSDPLVNEFLRQRIGIEPTNDLYAKQVPVAIWQVRYFQDSQPEEYTVKLGPDGAFLALSHKVAEEAPGASLSKEQARSRAEEYLVTQKRLDLSQWTLVEADSDKRPHRIDHELTWQQNSPVTGDTRGNAGHAYVRIKLAVIGDQVTDYRESYYPKPSDRVKAEEKEGGALWRYIKIPDEWRRSREQINMARVVVNYAIPIVFAAGLGVSALILFLKNLRSEAARRIPWKTLSLWAFCSLAAFLIVYAFGSTLATRLSQYDTAIPLKTYFAALAIGGLLGAPFTFGIALLIFGMAWYFAKRAFGEERIPNWLTMPGAYYRDALFIGLGGAAALVGLETLLQAASQYWPTVHRSAAAAFGTDFDAKVPALAILASAVQHSLLLTGAILAAAGFLANYARPAWLRALLFILLAVFLVPGNWGDAADLTKQLLAQLIFLSVAVLGFRRMVGFNVLGCLLILLTIALGGGALEMLKQGDSFYRSNGYALLAALAMILLWPFARWLKAPKPDLV